MVHPNTHLSLARARHEEILREASRNRLHHASGNERPGALARLAARLRRRSARSAAPASS
ncbi:MAG: hypothetical protein ACRDMU_05565 [Gaiellaceae bacterium]